MCSSDLGKGWSPAAGKFVTQADGTEFLQCAASRQGLVWIYFYFLKFIYFIYLFLAVLGLRCCARAVSSCGERGLLFAAVHGLLIAVASLVAQHGL